MTIRSGVWTTPRAAATAAASVAATAATILLALGAIPTSGPRPSEPHAAPSRPRPSAPANLSQAVEAAVVPRVLARQTACLAKAVYFEDRGDRLDGQMAVAHVVVNRTRSGAFATDLCEVVRQPNQFSFVHGHTIPEADRASAAWRRAVAIAVLARSGWPSRAEHALFFHAASISPGWRRPLVGRIGLHVFYR